MDAADNVNVPTPPGGVPLMSVPGAVASDVITLKDIFEKLQRISEDVAVLRQEARRVDVIADDHERRLRAIERRIWALPSVATVIAVVGLLLAVYDRVNGH